MLLSQSFPLSSKPWSISSCLILLLPFIFTYLSVAPCFTSFGCLMCFAAHSPAYSFGSVALRTRPAVPYSSALGISYFLLVFSNTYPGNMYELPGHRWPSTMSKIGVGGLSLPSSALRSIILRHGLHHLSEGHIRFEHRLSRGQLA